MSDAVNAAGFPEAAKLLGIKRGRLKAAIVSGFLPPADLTPPGIPFALAAFSLEWIEAARQTLASAQAEGILDRHPPRFAVRGLLEGLD
jgi:hypothetical protein